MVSTTSLQPHVVRHTALATNNQVTRAVEDNNRLVQTFKTLNPTVVFENANSTLVVIKMGGNEIAIGVDHSSGTSKIVYRVNGKTFMVDLQSGALSTDGRLLATIDPKRLKISVIAGQILFAVNVGSKSVPIQNINRSNATSL
jgi:hypothetical protein